MHRRLRHVNVKVQDLASARRLGPPTCMPIFLDSHLGTDLPVDGLRRFLRHARNGTRDAFGVRALDLYCGDDGRVFYVFSAPDEAAVRQQHAEHGVACARIRRVQLLGGDADQLSDEQKVLVRHMIVGEQALPASMGGLGQSDRWLRQVG